MGDNPTPAKKLMSASSPVLSTPSGCSRVDRIHGDGPRKGADAGNGTAEASPTSCFCFMTLGPSAYGTSTRDRYAVLNSTTSCDPSVGATVSIACDGD